ncbi:hypothetical protein NDU88_004942 [Pleurodeles waltl]|uniref:Uncharacterized protein n=1 Tax=Pleurodeles waltl TaxID=8319 RepID=A0AAV7WW73_PLEWA|nr:hypothetical protein NDU88_004942 [Pleurodeles waltl]
MSGTLGQNPSPSPLIFKKLAAAEKQQQQRQAASRASAQRSRHNAMRHYAFRRLRFPSDDELASQSVSWPPCSRC